MPLKSCTISLLSDIANDRSVSPNSGTASGFAPHWSRKATTGARPASYAYGSPCLTGGDADARRPCG